MAPADVVASRPRESARARRRRRPTGAVSLKPRAAWRTRALARAPRFALYGLVLVFAASGVRLAVVGPAPPTGVQQRAAGGADLAAQSFAESFARAYFTWDGRRQDLYVESFKRFGTERTAGVSAGFTPPRQGRQVAVHSAAVADEPLGRGLRRVTVQVDTTSGMRYLAVPVARARAGELYVAQLPALVGPPGVAEGVSAPAEEPVTDDALTAVATRAVTNYLARDDADLLADLDRDTVVSLPSVRLTANSVALTVIGRGRIAAEVVAADRAGATYRLRYELGVALHDRWYVTQIAASPTQGKEVR